MQTPKSDTTLTPTRTQVLVDGRWHDVRALHEYAGGEGYKTLWWTSRGPEGVGYDESTIRRKIREGTARVLTDEQYARWADAESIARLVETDEDAACGVAMLRLMDEGLSPAYNAYVAEAQR